MRKIRHRKARFSSKKKKKGFNRILTFLTFLLTFMGVVAVADVSSPQALRDFGDSFYFAKQQIIWASVGIVAMAVGAFVNYNFWRKFAFLIFIVTVVLLVAVLLPGVGSRFLGARRWISVGFVSFQPSEFVKLGIALFFAKLADRGYSIWYYAVGLGIVAALVMLQPDLGTTIVISGIGFVQMFLAGVNMFYLIGLLGLGGAASSLLIIFSDYRKARLMTFLESSTDPLGSSYHIRQILIAIGSGGIFGVGVGQSRQKYLFLPETATDSIFAILSEEIGFVGGIILIGLLMAFIFQLIKVASQAPDRFSQVLAGGIAAWIGVQTIANLGSMVALTPLTGIPLPFFSYGGSSLVMILFSVGILLNISKNSDKGNEG